MSSPYVAPSVTGTDTSMLTSQVFESALDFVDPNNLIVASLFVNPRQGATTDYDVFLAPGTYAPYSEIVPPVRFSFNAAAQFVQVLFQQVGSSITVVGSESHAVTYSTANITATIQVSFAIPGVDDPDNNSGEDNVIPLSFVVVCPSSEAFSLECANGLYISPSELLGGNVTIYDTSASNVAFTYTTLNGNVVVGPTVSVPASSSEQAITLTTSYSNPTMWGKISLTGDTNFQVVEMWTQACPASEAFSLTCANGVSEAIPSFDNSFFSNGSVQTFGYGIDLPAGSWKIAVAGSTDPQFATDRRLGAIVSVTVPNVYPVVNLNAAA